MEYTVSAIGRGESIFTVTDTQLSIRIPKRERRMDIPLTEVRRVKLLAMQGVCYTYLSTQQGKIRILSRSIDGPGRFEDKPLEYTLFVKELHEKLAKANRNTVYSAGSLAFFVMGWVFVALGLSAFVLRWGFGLRGTLPMGFAAALGVPLILLQRVKSYSPDALPAKYLP